MIIYDGVYRVSGEDRRLGTIKNEFTFENTTYKILKKKFHNEPRKWKYMSPYVTLFKTDGKWTLFGRGALSLFPPDEVKDLYERTLAEPFAVLDAFKPRSYQLEAALEISASENGYIRMPTSSGKTFTMTYAITLLAQKALILVDKVSLAHQWIQEIEKFTGYTPGLITSQGKKVVKDITVATYRSVKQEHLSLFSVIVVDEAHHCISPTFSDLIYQYQGKHLFGCTATDFRSDSIPIWPVLGGRLYDIKEKDLIASTQIIRPSYYVVQTPYTIGYNDDMALSDIYSLLLNIEDRNRDICHLVSGLYREGRTILVLTNRIHHAGTLSQILDEYEVPNEIIFGNVKAADRSKIIDNVRNKRTRCLIGSTVADEGLDIPALDTIVLTSPYKFEGKALQRVGRIVRTHEGKDSARIYDVVDIQEPLFRGQFNHRKKVVFDYFNLNTYKTIKVGVQ